MIQNSKAIIIFMAFYVIFTLALMLYSGINTFTVILFGFSVLLLVLVLYITYGAPGKGK